MQSISLRAHANTGGKGRGIGEGGEVGRGSAWLRAGDGRVEAKCFHDGCVEKGKSIDGSGRWEKVVFCVSIGALLLGECS